MADLLQHDDARGEELVSGAAERETTRQTDASGEAPAPQPGEPQTETPAPPAPSPAPQSGGPSVGTLKKGASFVGKHKKSFMFGGGGLIVFILPLLLLVMFASIFKIKDIEKLYIDYQFTKVDAVMRRRASSMAKDARAKAAELRQAGQPVGAADTLVDENAPLEEQYKKLNADQINKISTDPVDFKRTTDLMKGTSMSDADLGLKLNSEFGINRSIEKIDDAKKGQTEIDKAVKESDRATVQKGAVIDGPLQDVSKTIADSEKAGVDPDVATAATHEQSAKIFSGIATWSTINQLTTFYCITKDIYDQTLGKALANHQTQGLVRLAARSFTAADAATLGKLSLKQVGGYSDLFDKGGESFTMSASYKKATHQAVNTNPASPGFNPDLSPAAKPFTTDTNAFFSTLNKAFDPFPEVKNACNLLLQPAAQISILGIETIIGVATAGIDAGADGAVNIAIKGISATILKRQFAFDLAKGLVKTYTYIEVLSMLGSNVAANHTGGATSGTENPISRANKVDAGTDIMASDSSRLMGGRVLTNTESNAVADMGYRDQQSQLTMSDRLFSLNNPRSVGAMMLAAVPTSPLTGMRQLSRYLGTVFTPTYWTSLLFGGHAQADANTPDPYGVPQYGFTKAELDLYDPLENAAYVEAHPELATAYASCFDGSKSFVDATMGDPDYAKCNNAGDVGLTRYRIYLLDKHVSRDFALLYNKTTTPSSTGGTSTPAPTTPTGSSSQLATQLLANPNFSGEAGVVQDLTAVAAGQAITNSCGNTTGLSASLLQTLLTASSKYKLKLSTIVTGHHCANSTHPLGQAADIEIATDLASGATTNFGGADNRSVDRSLLTYLMTILPPASGIGQTDCPGRTGLAVPAGFNAFTGDGCNHQHIDVRGTP